MTNKNTCPKKSFHLFIILFVALIALLPCSIKAQENTANEESANNINEIRKKAAEGNTVFMMILGNAYLSGKNISKDSIEALKWFTKAAEEGNPKAMYILGYLYENGKVIPKDTTLALKWYMEGAEAGDPNAQNNLGLKYRKGRWVSRDYSKSIKWFKRSADAGNPYGLYNLGIMYQYGKGMRRDNAAALKWFLKAAAKSSKTGATYAIAHFYEAGRGGLPIDIDEAIKWYQKTDAKDVKAGCMYRLGNIYETGKGNIKADTIEAMKYYQASADGGNATGMYLLGHVYELTQKTEEAALWYKKAFDLFTKEIVRWIDDSELMIGLAMMYEMGKGTEKNMEKATALYKQAAELGNEDAELKIKNFKGN